MEMWEELVSIVETLELSDVDDEVIWQYNSSGIYSSKSLYAVINFRGVTPVFISSMWGLRVPPRIHFFLWLMSKNKFLKSSNQGKRRVEDRTCLFCSEIENIAHLFFDCIVARQAWAVISEVFHFQIGADYESVAKHWLCNKKFGTANVFSSALCWGLWKLRNLLCFQGVAWLGIKMVMEMMIPMLRC
jgi:hypothetical protein